MHVTLFFCSLKCVSHLYSLSDAIININTQKKPGVLFVRNAYAFGANLKLSFVAAEIVMIAPYNVLRAAHLAKS